MDKPKQVVIMDEAQSFEADVAEIDMSGNIPKQRFLDSEEW